jgi:hypothetical protein
MTVNAPNNNRSRHSTQHSFESRLKGQDAHSATKSLATTLWFCPNADGFFVVTNPPYQVSWGPPITVIERLFCAPPLSAARPGHLIQCTFQRSAGSNVQTPSVFSKLYMNNSFIPIHEFHRYSIAEGVSSLEIVADPTVTSAVILRNPTFASEVAPQ